MGSLEALIDLGFSSTQTSISVKLLAKKKHKNYDAIQKWQDNWATQFAWEKSEMVDNMLVFVNYTVCETITSRLKHIVPKCDNLEKHMGKWQADYDIPSKGLKENEIYYDKNNKHVQNLTLFNT